MTRPSARVLIRLTVIAALTAAVLRDGSHVRWHDAWIAVQHASVPLLGVVFVTHLASILCRGVVWSLFLTPLGAPSLTLACRGTLVCSAVNSFLVGNGGEVARAMVVTRATGLRKSSVIATIGLERLVNVTAFVLLALAAPVLVPIPGWAGHWRSAGIAVLPLAIVLIVVAGVLFLRPSTKRSAAGVVRRRSRLFATRVWRAARRGATPRRIALAFLFAIADHLLELASYHAAARAAHFPMSVSASFIALLVVNVGFVARATPGNIGVFELSYAAAAHTFGLPADRAIGVALLLHLVQDLPTTLIGLSLMHTLFASRAVPAARRPSACRRFTPALEDRSP